MKKVSLLLAAFIALGLCGCATAENSNSASSSPQQSSPVEDSSSGSQNSPPEEEKDDFDPTADKNYGNLVLEMEEGRTELKILQLSDIQIVDPDQAPYEGRLKEGATTQLWRDRDATVYNLVRQLVEYSDPDLIVLMGDNVYGSFDPNFEVLDHLISVMESFETPWTTVMGNHDEETPIADASLGGTSFSNAAFQARSAAIAEKYENAEYCLYERGAASMGNGNFTITVKQGTEIRQLLVFMDSHGCHGSVEGACIEPGNLSSEQMTWYEAQIQGVNEAQFGKVGAKTNTVNSLAFMHVALPEYARAYMQYTGSVYDVPMTVPEDNENGDFGGTDNQLSFYYQSKMFETAKRLGSTKGFFAGHNHLANFSILYDGIRLTFGNKTGKYDSHSVEKQGGTLITLKDGGNSFTVRHIYDYEVADIEI